MSGFTGDEEEEKEPSTFHINGLEIDLDELDALERKVAEKRRTREREQELKKTEEGITIITTGAKEDEGPDYLDEYLERLQISREDEKKDKETGTEAVDVVGTTPSGSDGGPVVVSRYSFLRLLLLFMSIVSMAKLLNYGNGGRQEWHINFLCF